MELEKREKRGNLYFALILILFLFYYTYRYILQYNDASSSAFVYDYTPEWIKWPKYILYMIILALMAWNERGIHLEKQYRLVKIPVLILILQCGICGVLIRDQQILTFTLMLIPILLYPGIGGTPREETVEKILNIFWIYTTVYEIIQVVLFYTTGRVPALAFPHLGAITAIRYGGALDDPNGYAMILIFYIFYFLTQKGSVRSYVCLVVTLAMLVFTWSGTGYLVLLATALVLLLLRIRDRELLKKYGIIALAVLIIAIPVALIAGEQVWDFIVGFIQGKGYSTNLHMKSWDVSGIQLSTWLGVHPARDTFREVGYLRLVEIGGIWAALLFLFASIAGIIKGNKELSARQEASRPLYYGSLAYLIGFLFSMLNLPHLTNFSVMGPFSVFLILSISQAKKKES